MNRNVLPNMVNSLIAIVVFVFCYVTSAKILHLGTFLLDRYTFNFFLLYIPSLIFFSSLFETTDEVFVEVERIVAYSFVPAVAFVAGRMMYSFYLAFPICYALSNFYKPNFSKRLPVIIFNGLAIFIYLFGRVKIG